MTKTKGKIIFFNPDEDMPPIGWGGSIDKPIKKLKKKKKK